MQFSGWRDIDIVNQLRSADLQPMGVGRSGGLHLGTIIQSMRAQAGLPQGAPVGDQYGVRLQEGFIWESVCEFMLAGVPMWEAIKLAFARYQMSLREGVLTQIKLERDGIHMTPDAHNDPENLLESYKVTRKTLRKALEQHSFESEFWPWLVQEKSYCLAAGLDTARWFVWWMAGDYSKGPGSGPRMMYLTCTFTPEELEANWRLVLNHKRGMQIDRAD